MPEKTRGYCLNEQVPVPREVVPKVAVKLAWGKQTSSMTSTSLFLLLWQLLPQCDQNFCLFYLQLGRPWTCQFLWMALRRHQRSPWPRENSLLSQKSRSKNACRFSANPKSPPIWVCPNLRHKVAPSQRKRWPVRVEVFHYRQ